MGAKSERIGGSLWELQHTSRFWCLASARRQQSGVWGNKYLVHYASKTVTSYIDTINYPLKVHSGGQGTAQNKTALLAHTATKDDNSPAGMNHPAMCTRGRRSSIRRSKDNEICSLQARCRQYRSYQLVWRPSHTWLLS